MLQVGRTFRFAFIQSGKDPDELIQSKGLDAFKEVLQGSLPLWDVLWERETASADVRTPDGRAALERWQALAGYGSFRRQRPAGCVPSPIDVFRDRPPVR